MDKYKINYIYDKNNDINDIFVRVLNRELKKYISCKQFSLEISKNYYDEFK